MSARIDLMGKEFGRLTVVEFAEIRNKRAYWKCKCLCGNICVAGSSDLVRDKSRSCGCLQKERASEVNTTHGMCSHRLYYAWHSMRQRCSNPNNKHYVDYGGRGISVCDRWLQLDNFVADMGECPEGKSIDRIDNNGNYCPENCRWATSCEQAVNRRTTIHYTVNGITGTLRQLYEELSCEMQYGTLASRIQLGWSIEEALFTPVGEKRKRST